MFKGKTQVHLYLIMRDLLVRGVGHGDLQRSLPASAILWSCDLSKGLSDRWSDLCLRLPWLWNSFFQDGGRLNSLLNLLWQHPSRQGGRGQTSRWFWQALTGSVWWTRVELRGCLAYGVLSQTLAFQQKGEQGNHILWLPLSTPTAFGSFNPWSLPGLRIACLVTYSGFLFYVLFQFLWTTVLCASTTFLVNYFLTVLCVIKRDMNFIWF